MLRHIKNQLMDCWTNKESLTYTIIMASHQDVCLDQYYLFYSGI